MSAHQRKRRPIPPRRLLVIPLAAALSLLLPKTAVADEHG